MTLACTQSVLSVVPKTVRRLPSLLVPAQLRRRCLVEVGSEHPRQLTAATPTNTQFRRHAARTSLPFLCSDADSTETVQIMHQ